MDWSKAKSIMIIVFLLLNIFLAITVKKFYFSNEIPKESVANIVSTLKQRNVDIKCDISYAKKAAGTLSLQDNTREKSKVYSDVENQSSIDTLDKSKVESFAKQEALKLGLPSDQYYLDDLTSDLNKVTATLYQKYNEFIVFDNYFKVIFENGIPKNLEYRYNKITGTSEVKDIMPIYKILLMNSREISNMVITEINIGYKEHIFEENIKEPDDIPVWRIKNEKGQELFFKAYTGEKL